jgi:hypothetical protein
MPVGEGITDNYVLDKQKEHDPEEAWNNDVAPFVMKQSDYANLNRLRGKLQQQSRLAIAVRQKIDLLAASSSSAVFQFLTRVKTSANRYNAAEDQQLADLEAKCKAEMTAVDAWRVKQRAAGVDSSITGSIEYKKQNKERPEK